MRCCFFEPVLSLFPCGQYPRVDTEENHIFPRMRNHDYSLKGVKGWPQHTLHIFPQDPILARTVCPSGRDMASGLRQWLKWNSTLGLTFFIIIQKVASWWNVSVWFICLIIVALTGSTPTLSLPWQALAKKVRYLASHCINEITNFRENLGFLELS